MIRWSRADFYDRRRAAGDLHHQEAPESSEWWLGPDSALGQFVVRESETRLEGYRLNRGDIEEHAAIEQSVIDGGYGHRQLFELIQNAADAIRAADITGRVESRLTPESLYVANEGRPVDEEGADSILRSHISTKRSHEIGHFGLGFKSVLGISERIALLDRLGHHAHILTTRGESYRTRHARRAPGGVLHNEEGSP